VELANLSSRDLVATEAAISEASISADGSTLYYETYSVPEESQNFMVFSVPPTGGNPLLVTDRAQWWLEDPIRHGFLPAPASGRLALALRQSDPPWSLFLWDPASGNMDLVTQNASAVVAFSPAEDEILYFISGQYRIVTLADGSSRPVDYAPKSNEFEFIELMHWDDGGIRLLTETFLTDLSVVGTGPMSGTRRRIWQPAGREHLSGPEAWSSDGRRIAFWTGECIKDLDWFSCGVGQNVLYVKDLQSDELIQLAVGKTHGQDSGPARLAFSLDGRSLAYVFNGSLYFKSIR
jgi:hypothetical protein